MAGIKCSDCLFFPYWRSPIMTPSYLSIIDWSVSASWALQMNKQPNECAWNQQNGLYGRTMPYVEETTSTGGDTNFPPQPLWLFPYFLVVLVFLACIIRAAHRQAVRSKYYFNFIRCSLVHFATLFFIRFPFCRLISIEINESQCMRAREQSCLLLLMLPLAAPLKISLIPILKFWQFLDKQSNIKAAVDAVRSLLLFSMLFTLHSSMHTHTHIHWEGHIVV